jgi:hypothetical protein
MMSEEKAAGSVVRGVLELCLMHGVGGSRGAVLFVLEEMAQWIVDQKCDSIQDGEDGADEHAELEAVQGAILSLKRRRG